jgi:uncharacterized protein (TIGR03067 family)
MGSTLLLALALGAPALKDAPKKGADLVGEWVVETSIYGGRPRALAKNPLSYVFDADGTWTFHREGREIGNTRAYRHDPEADPPTIVLKYEPTEQDGAEAFGIYKIDGDTLTLCYGRPGSTIRPTVFASPEGSGINLVVLRRARPKD